MSATKKRILFVMSEFEIGGPQKSMLALLDRLDYARLDVFVYLLMPGGRLQEYLDPRVHLVQSDPIIAAATLPSQAPVRALLRLVLSGRLGIATSSILGIIRHLLGGANMNRQRQRVWKRHSSSLPRLSGTYDAAFGVQGLSSYFVVDCVDARRRYHWIRSDTRILQRDEAIDAEYFRQMDGALAVSETCAEIFERLYPFMRGAVRVFHNYIPVRLYERLDADTTLMDVPTGYLKILTICRLDPLKGLELAVDACRMLLDSGVKVRWFVLGDGVFRSELESLVRERGLENDFCLLGYQVNTLAYIRVCDVFVHPSRTEGKANVIDEARYVGRPIVVTRYPTVSDQIRDGVNGIVCDMSAEAIAASIGRLSKEPGLASRLASYNRGIEDGVADATAFFEALCEPSQ